MEGRFREAKLKYVEAEKLAKKVGFGEGVVNAKAGLKRVRDAEGKGS